MKSNMVSNLAMNYATNIRINGFINWNKLHGINLKLLLVKHQKTGIYSGQIASGPAISASWLSGMCSEFAHGKITLENLPEMGNVHPFSIPNYSNDRATLQKNEPRIHPFSRFIHVYPFAKWFVFPGVTLRKVREVNHGAKKKGPVMLHPSLSGSVVFFYLETWRLILRLIRGC